MNKQIKPITEQLDKYLNLPEKIKYRPALLKIHENSRSTRLEVWITAPEDFAFTIQLEFPNDFPIGKISTIIEAIRSNGILITKFLLN